MPEVLKAPFPAFGGKSRVADLVWSRLGDVTNYIEPFCRSAAVLLKRPHAPRVETVNDLDCYIANFWRAVQADPEGVAVFADWPVSEADLHARHRWLVLSRESEGWRQAMRTDPDHFDVRIAGWWVWGACCWIGGGWCDDTGRTADGSTQDRRPVLSQAGKYCQMPSLSGEAGAAGRGVHAIAGPKQKLPDISGAHGSANGRGVTGQHRKRIKIPDGGVGTGVHGKTNHENRPQLGDAYCRGRGVHSNDDAGTCQQRIDWLTDWFRRLADRLRVVRVCCGDWLRVCDSHSVTTRLGTTGIFLDPPYKVRLADGTKNRDGGLYGNDHLQDVNELVDRVIAYCVERGGDPQMRIAACCLEGEGYEVLAQHGWECVPWKAQGGYGNRSACNANRDRERIWFSPHCLEGTEARQGDLFDLKL